MSTSPWQNGDVERAIGSIRRECLDHIIVFGEAHLRVLKTYAVYYNDLRTHLALAKERIPPSEVSTTVETLAAEVVDDA